MEPERKNGSDAGNHNFALLSERAASQKGPEKSGLLKRFIDEQCCSETE